MTTMDLTTGYSTIVLPADILVLICEQLEGDSATLANIGATCRAWHTLAIPYLLRTIDLSSHNAGRLFEHESSICPQVWADYSDRHRPSNLVRRQRQFLRLISERPEYAKHVRSLTWTLIWLDFEDEQLTDTDRTTWDAFSKMTNVSKLDLASFHEIVDEPYVRQNPQKLFPAVNDLRLSGWMHRGFARAIITSLAASQLRRLDLNCLTDEGAFPNGDPMPYELARRTSLTYHYRDTSIYKPFSDEMRRRQDNGTACIWPGPMWLPLRYLSSSSLGSLTDFSVRIPSADATDDQWNFYTFFHDTAQVVSRSSSTLRTLKIIFENIEGMYNPDTSGRCSQYRIFLKVHRREAPRIAADFMKSVLKVLNSGSFPQLSKVDMEGFHILTMADAGDPQLGLLEEIFAMIRDSPIPGADTWLQTPRVEYRYGFGGIDYEHPDDHIEDRYIDLLELNTQV